MSNALEGVRINRGLWEENSCLHVEVDIDKETLFSEQSGLKEYTC